MLGVSGRTHEHRSFSEITPKNQSIHRAKTRTKTTQIHIVLITISANDPLNDVYPTYNSVNRPHSVLNCTHCQTVRIICLYKTKERVNK